MVLKLKIYFIYYLFWSLKHCIGFFYKPKIRFLRISQSKILILPPFCMSSAFKREGNNFKESTDVSNYSEIYILTRPDSQRFRSCYQKKIYSATTIKKILLLIYAGFRPFMSKEDFIEKICLQESNDFHFLTIKNILLKLNVKKPCFVEFDKIEKFCMDNGISYPKLKSASSNQINKDFFLEAEDLIDIENQLSNVNN